jgi:hormone-sensitive lipase
LIFFFPNVEAVILLQMMQSELFQIADLKERVPNVLPQSPALIIHCHGGGFVAQSSRSHEIYLRDWACQLKVPILSIDYSLAPQAPFPRALEEVLYAYCWAINNARIMGSTAEKVILVGELQ